MKKTMTTLFTVLSALTLIINANAGSAAPKDTKTKVPSQQERINNSFKAGLLTKAEYDQLSSEQKTIRDQRKNFKADGKISEQERATLDASVALQNQKIHDERNDMQMNFKKLKKSFQKRIRNGVERGKLNNEERQELNQVQGDIAEEHKKINADGNVTVDERDKFIEMVNAQNQDIYDEKHDNEDRVYTQEEMDRAREQ